jgi:hypothetical protein
MFQKHYILLLPEGRTGKVWEHSTDYAFSKTCDHWIQSNLNVVFVRLTDVFQCPLTLTEIEPMPVFLILQKGKYWYRQGYFRLRWQMST